MQAGARKGGAAWIALCPLDSLPEGASRGFELDDGDAVFAVRRSGHVVVYRDLCPHYGSTRLAWRRDAYLAGDGTRILCAAHGAEFDIDTGACLIGPCLGQALTPIPAELRDGWLWIALGGG